jgi:hypothetical protein
VPILPLKTRHLDTVRQLSFLTTRPAVHPRPRKSISTSRVPHQSSPPSPRQCYTVDHGSPSVTAVLVLPRAGRALFTLGRYASKFRPWCFARRLVNGTTRQDQSGVRPPNGSLRESPHRQGLLHQIDLPAAVPYRFACGRQSSFPLSSGRRARFYLRKFSTGMVLLLFWPISSSDRQERPRGGCHLGFLTLQSALSRAWQG